MFKVELNYYDKKEEKLFSKQPYCDVKTTERVLDFKKHSSIRKADFFSYYLIHRNGLNNAQDFASRLAESESIINYIKPVISTDLTINSVLTYPIGGDYAERIGEAIGLAVISQMHNLIDADWTKIEITPSANGIPSFDFDYASDNQRVIQLETKGSIVENNTKKCNAIYQHATNIRGKKKDLGNLHELDPNPAFIRYSTISSIDNSHEAACLLIDPKAINLNREPRQIKIIKRLAFIGNAINILAPNATLPKAIFIRLDDLIKNEESFETFNKRKLNFLDSDGFFNSKNYVRNYFSKNKFFFPEEGIVGKAFKTREEWLLFFGIDRKLIETAIDQDFEEIINLKYGDNKEMILEMTINKDEYLDSKYEKFRQINVAVSSGGLAFGEFI